MTYLSMRSVIISSGTGVPGNVVTNDAEPGMLVCFTALGSGLHRGAVLYRA